MFFLREESGAVHVEGGEGMFFMSPGDAKSKLRELKNSDGIKVNHAQVREGRTTSVDITIKYWDLLRRLWRFEVGPVRT